MFGSDIGNPEKKYPGGSIGFTSSGEGIDAGLQ